MLVLYLPVGEWQLCFNVFQACWQCLSSTLQPVSGCCSLLCFKPADDACPLLSSWWVAGMSCCVSSLLIIPSSAVQAVSGHSALLYFESADDACPLLPRMWVTAVPCCVSSLLMMPVLCSPESEWLCLAVFQTSWWHLSSALQEVSGWCALLCVKPADDACALLSRKWVASVPCCVSSLLIAPALCSPGGEWLMYPAVFQAC